MRPSFLTESAADFEETKTIGTYLSRDNENSFDAVFESVHDEFIKESINPKLDVNTMIKSNAVMAAYKDALLQPLRDDAVALESVDNGHAHAVCKQVEQLWDNCREDMILESTRVGNLLPFQAVDYPILVSQHLKSAAKDIMQTEVVNSPVVKKQMEITWAVDTKSNKKWQYPQCFFDDSFTEIYNAGKGLPIKTDKVALPLFQYDLITNLTDGGNPLRDRITINLKITKAYDAAGTEYPIDMSINLSDRQWQGGEIKVKDPVTNQTDVKDYLSGSVDFTTGKVTVTSASGFITEISFEGYLSNELNERSVTFDYSREEKQFKIEDGFRMNVAYSLEELEDAKALLSLDLYKKTYNNLSEFQNQMEDSNILKYLDDQFNRWVGKTGIDTLQLDASFAKTDVFDCDHTQVSGVLQADYIERMLKFKIDRILCDIADDAKLEDMTFVIYGNPRFISLLGDNVKWVLRAGDTLGGVKLNYSYGVFTTGNIKVTVVSTNKISAKKMKGLRIVPFPISKEQFTHKHFKYSSHILTDKNSAYKAADRPGGSKTNLMAVNRCLTVSIRGIQTQLDFQNVNFINIYI